MQVTQQVAARPMLWLFCAACCAFLCYLYPETSPISGDFSSYIAALAVVLPFFALLAALAAFLFYVSLCRKTLKNRGTASLLRLAIGSFLLLIAFGPALLFAMGELLGALRYGWITLDWFSYTCFAVIILVIGSGCGYVIRRPRESLNFARSRVGIVSSVIALIFAFLPLGCWYSAGIVRWQGGCPFYFILAQGDTPTATSDWGFAPLSMGLWWAWQWRLPVDWLFWMFLVSSSAIAARAISRPVSGHVRWGYIFAVFICLLFMVYRYSFGGVLSYVLESYLVS
jgi:hypothetical protein